jgi:hypothetical protein
MPCTCGSIRISSSILDVFSTRAPKSHQESAWKVFTWFFGRMTAHPSTTRLQHPPKVVEG